MEVNSAQRLSSEGGSLKISDEVIATITRLAALEVNGVSDLAPAPVSMKDMFVKSPIPKSIRINISQDVVEIDVSIVVKFGAKVVELAQKVQNNVKASVQNMTGLTVSKVNVYVAGIHFDE